MNTLNNHWMFSAKDGLKRLRFRQRDRDDNPGGLIERPPRVAKNWRKILTNIRVFSLSMLLTVACGFATPTFAVDIEIYSDTLDSSGTLIPNILFMLDSSESMQYKPGTDAEGNLVLPDSTQGEKSRMEILTEAMLATLEEMQKAKLNANVGIGRFTRVLETETNQGEKIKSNAPIIFPVIPDPTTQILQRISVPVRQSLDDAMEMVSATESRNGTMNVDSSTLIIVSIITVTVGYSKYEISLHSRDGQTWKYRVKLLTGSGESFSWALDTACQVDIGSDMSSGDSNEVFEFTLDKKYPGTPVGVQINGNTVSEIVGPNCGVTTGTETETAPVFDPYTTIIEDGDSQFKVSFQKMVENANGTTTWTYKAEEVDTSGGSLAHWRLMGDDSKTTSGTEWWQCHLLNDANYGTGTVYASSNSGMPGAVSTGSNPKMQGLGWSSTGEVSFTLPRKFPVGYIYAFAGVTATTDPKNDLTPPKNPILGPLCHDTEVRSVDTCNGEICDNTYYKIRLTSFVNNQWTYQINPIDPENFDAEGIELDPTKDYTIDDYTNEDILRQWKLVLPQSCLDNGGLTSTVPAYYKVLNGNKIWWTNLPTDPPTDSFVVTLNGDTLDDEALSGNHIAGKVSGDLIPIDGKTDGFKIVGPAVCDKPLEHEPSSCELVNANDTGTMTICHRPYGNPDKAQTIEIPKSEWPTHRQGGDVVGKCFKDIVAETLNHKGEREIDQAKCQSIAQEVSNANGADKITICHNVREDKSSNPEPELPCNGNSLATHLDQHDDTPAHMYDAIAVYYDVDGDGQIEDDAQCGFDGPPITCPVNAESEKYKVGLRFEYVDIPKGATITSAKIRFNSASNHADTDDSATFVIKVEDTDNALSFNDSPFDISDRTSLFGNVEWEVNHWSSTATPETPDLSELVQHIVGDSNGSWCGGNSIAFIIDGDGNGTLHRAWSYDGNPELAPRLEVEFTTTSQTDGCMQQSSFTSISRSENDAEEIVDNGDVFVTDDILDVGTGTGGARIVGLRFENVPVSSGTDNIVEAHLILPAQADSNANDGSVSLTITAEASVDSQPFNTDDGSLSSQNNRPRLSKTKSWSITEPWLAGQQYRSVDIKDIVQQLVDQTGWDASDQTMTFFLTRESGSGTRKAVSFDSDSSQAATLHIKVKGRLEELDAQDSLPIVIEKMMVPKEKNWYTPIVDALYESLMYYRGGKVTYGKDRQKQQEHLISIPGSYTHQPADPDNPIYPEFKFTNPQDGEQCNRFDNPFSSKCATEKIKDGNGDDAVDENGVGLIPMYNSPIEQMGDCKSNNYIVLLTDGKAETSQPGHSANNQSVGDIETLFDQESFDDGLEGEYCKKAYPNFTENDHEKCGIALAKFLHQRNDVVTHTVSFGLSEGTHELEYLDRMAKAGGSEQGVYKINTSDPNAVQTQLTKTFLEIILNATKGTSSFAPAGIAISRFNRMRHDNEVYYALFENAKTRSWLGNVKKFEFKSVDTTTDSKPVCTDETPKENCELTLVGKGDEVATDGPYLSENAADLWAGVDENGNEILSEASKITSGGAGSRLVGGTSRSILTYSGSAPTVLEPLTTNHVDLDTLHWIQGTTSAGRSWLMAESLHSSPTAITYGENDTKVVVGTNDGLLRMIDAENGTEDWAFLPPELFQIQTDLMTSGHMADEDPLLRQHIYGMDGTPTVWVKENDIIRLFVGMRRGGYNYYGLNVTNAHNPELMWVVGNSDTNFANLGQTWSSPKPVRVHNGYCNAIENNGALLDPEDKTCIALLFGGGYDPVLDDFLDEDEDGKPDVPYTLKNHRVDKVDGKSIVGNAIYMVHAETGQLLWKASSDANTTSDLKLDDMLYPIPSDLTVLDTDGNGTKDRLYVADVAGQVWRIDLIGKQKATSGSYLDQSRGGRLANLSSTDVANKRQFFYPPAWGYTETGEEVIALTSGSRVYPKTLRNVQNRVYVIFDTSTWTSTETGRDELASTTITESNLKQVGGSSSTGDKGWYKNLVREGEKGLARPVILKKASETNPNRKLLLFTTYTPAPLPGSSESTTGQCGLDEGTSRLYTLNLFDGSPASDDDSSTEEDDDSSTEDPSGGGGPETPEDESPDDGTSDDGNSEDGSTEIGKGINSDINLMYTEDKIDAIVGSQAHSLGERPPPQRVFWIQQQ
jgi:type IV pilus assembly protein PilY1